MLVQYRDITIAENHYPHASFSNIVPASDGAGEVVAVGEDVKKWKVGDRVCANFALDFVAGVPTPDLQACSLGGPLDGTLTEYQVFPDYVSRASCLYSTER